MVAVKAHQAEAFLKAPGPSMPAVLFYGTDAGLVSERAAKLAAVVAARDNPPGEIIRMEDADLDNDPDRLAIELQTIPMFGGSKVVRATAGRRITAAALEPFIAGDRLAATLIVEGGNLRPTDTLRTLFEKAPKAAAVACYPGRGARPRDARTRHPEGPRARHLAGSARSPADARRRRPRAVARRDRQARALCRRQVRDRR